MLRVLRSRFADAFDREIPPHSYAMLRIAIGAVGLAGVLGMTPFSMYWPLDGLSPLPGSGARAWIAARDLGSVTGAVLFIWLVCSFSAMTVGFRSDLAVFSSFIGQVALTHWNNLPLSSAHQVATVLLFCLIWAPTGQVWSLDARWRKNNSPQPAPAWPLWLMRIQIAIVYLSSGLHKFAYPMWRDGSAVHWALNLNAFHRFPSPWPASFAPLEAFLTWSTLAFELTFCIFVLFRRTRPWILLAGIGLHIGLFLSLELGPFSPLMIAGYLCYLAPETTQKLFRPRKNL
jgi:hypothetical protein